MQDYLKDIVQHTHALGTIEVVKITGTAQETLINTIAEDRTVIVEAKFKNPVPEFVGTFGMPNLGKLKTILGIDEYREGANITVSTQKDAEGNTVPSGITFANAAGDFKNEYRFMTAGVVNDKLKAVKFRGVKWNVDIVPAVASIQRMRFQASANSEETTFTTRTENGALKFYFGDASSHAGNFVFDGNVSGTLSKNWHWPVGAVLAIFALPGNKTFKISDEGAAMITVDSGIADYSYIIPALTK